MGVICQACGNVEATVHLTDIEHGENKERHLCAECAEEEGVVMKSHQVPLNELLSKFVMQKASVQELADLTCDLCGTTFVEFRSSGLLGCSNDYDVFKRALDPLIERSHEGANRHFGKVPAKVSGDLKKRLELGRLQRELKQAVTEEQYESAASLRDQIAKLEAS